VLGEIVGSRPKRHDDGCVQCHQAAANELTLSLRLDSRQNALAKVHRRRDPLERLKKLVDVVEPRITRIHVADLLMP
jgi:hypothetical protein